MRLWVTAAATLALAAGAPTVHAAVTPDYFTLPADLKNAGDGIAAAPDGTVFFGSSRGVNTDQPPIGRLDPALAVPGTSNGITAIETGDNPASTSAQIRDLTWSTVSNALWFTRSDGMVGRVDGTTAQSTIVPGNIDLSGIAPDAEGGAWFSEHGEDNSAHWYGNRIGHVTATLGLFEATNLAFQNGRTTVDNLRYPAQPRGMATAPNGTPWFVEENVGNPGYRIATWDGGKYTEYFPPCAGTQPCSGQFTGPGLFDVAVAPDGSLWYTNQFTRSVGRLVPGGDVSEYKLADMGPGLGAGLPRAIKLAVDGSLWVVVHGGFSAPAANAIVRIDPADVTKTVHSLGAAMQPLDLAPDTKGNVWFTGIPQGTTTGTIARLAGVVGVPAPPVTGGVTPPTVISQPVDTATKLTPAVTTKAEISKPTVHGDSITANQICVGPPQDRCSLIYLIQTHEYVKGFPGAKGSAKPKLTTIGKKSVTLRGGQKAKVTIKLNAKGKKLLKKIKKFKATLTVTQSRTGAKATQVLKKNVTFKR